MENSTIHSPLRVAVYCQIRADWDEDGSALAARKDHCARIIAENPDWVKTGCFVDKRRPDKPEKKRAGFRRMLRRCHRGEIDLILTDTFSSFGRNTLEIIQYTRELRDMGVTVIFEKARIDSSAPEFERYVELYAIVAQKEAASITRNSCHMHYMVLKPRWTLRSWITYQFLKRGVVVNLWPSKRRFIKLCAPSMKGGPRT